MRRRGTLIAGALILGAAAAYAYRWRQNYKHLESLPPEDIAGAVALSESERETFDGFARWTCMDSCCVDQDAIDLSYFIDPEDLC